MAKQTFGQFRSTMILTWSSIKMFVRNRQALFFTFFMPVIIMTVFGLVGFDKVPKIPAGMTAPICCTYPSPGKPAWIHHLRDVGHLISP